MKIYARQVNPEYVDTTTYLEDYFESDSNFAIDGGRHFYSYNDDIIVAAKECVDNYYEMDYGYHANITEFFEYYLAGKHNVLKKKLSPRMVGYLKRELDRNDLSMTNYTKNFICAVFKAIKGMEYEITYLRGSTQGDVVELYAPINTDRKVIDDLEAMYWNLGSEIVIHDEDYECESADDVCGMHIYVNAYDVAELKEAVAEYEGANAKDVVLWMFKGYTQVANYELA